MGKKKVTLSIDSKTYKDFQKYCEDHAIMLSKKIELIMKEIMKGKGKKFLFMSIFSLVFTILLVGFVNAEIVDRGSYWDNNENVDGSNTLKIFNSRINYNNGSEFVRFNYGSCGSNCFRDSNGLIYRLSNDSRKAYVNLYDINDNYLSSFGFGITGKVGSINYLYTTLNFTWTWSNQSNSTTGEFVFTGWNGRTNFNWTQEYHFYPNQSMKIKNRVENNLGVDITNAKFWYIQTVNETSGIWFNGTRFNNDTNKSGEFDNLISRVRFEDDYVFNYDDLLANGFNITNFYLGNGSVIGVPSIRILAIGITKGLSILPNGANVTIDPTITIGADEGGKDAYVANAGNANKNFGTNVLLKTGDGERSYLNFNISAIPINQQIDNSLLCLYDTTSKTQLINVSHVYEDFNETDITWNNQPCGTNFDNSSACNITAESFVQMNATFQNTYLCWDVTNSVGRAYSSGDFVSLVLHTTDSDVNSFNSREAASNLPFLNVTYSLSDIVSPNLSLIFPLNQSYNSNISELNYTVSDDNLDSCWYSLNNGLTNNTIATCGNNVSNLTSNEGSNTWTIYANDTIGNENSSQITFIKDTIAPNINLGYPNGFINSNTVFFNYTPTDPNLESCSLYGNFSGSFGINQTDILVISNIVNQFNLTLNEGSYSWSVFCNDTLSNSASSNNQTFIIDSTIPSLTLSDPAGTYSSRIGIPLDFVTGDSNLDTCFYNVFRGSNEEIVNTTTSCNSSTTFDVTVDADFILNFYVNDSAGNLNTTSVSFTVSTSSSPPPSSGGGGGGGGVVTSPILSIGNIDSFIAISGENKRMSLNARNTGLSFLNSCILEGGGENSNWINYFGGSVQIGGGESHDFSFSLGIPNDLKAGLYNVSVGVSCNERSKETIFIVEIIEKQIDFNLLNTVRNSNTEVTVTYSLEELSGLNQNLELQFLLFDSNEEKVSEIIENVDLSANQLQEFELIIPIDSSLSGSFNLLINLNSETYSTFIQEDIILAPRGTGLAIFANNSTSSKVLTSIFGIMFFVFVAFMVVRIFKLRRKTRKSRDYSK